MVLMPNSLLAELSSDKGREVMDKVFKSYDSFKHFTGALTMVLRNRAGKERTRKMKVYAHEMENDGDRTIIFFDHPRDIKGTALLTHTHYDGMNDQWIYLPGFKRTKRIGGNSKASPFMGSEFSYEDMSGMELPMYSYKYLKSVKLEKIPCHVIELTPKYPDSGYGYIEVWVNKVKLRIEMIEFYDKDKKRVKTLQASGFRKYQDKFWHPDKLSMHNHHNGKETDLMLKNLNYEKYLDTKMFTVQSLRKLK